MLFIDTLCDVSTKILSSFKSSFGEVEKDIAFLHRVVEPLLTVVLALLIAYPQSVEAYPHNLETLAKQGGKIELNPSNAGRKRKRAEVR